MIRRFSVFWMTMTVASLSFGMAAQGAPIHLPIGLAAVGEAPEITAEAWILFDDTYQVVLGEVNADEQRPMASTTKIMTGILAVENGNMDDLVTVSQQAVNVGEAEINLEVGERLTLRQLTGALMVRSANDAAIAVGEHLAGSLPDFVELMNAKAVDMGLANTHFQNPHGLDAAGHYTSARDLLSMARYGMGLDQFAAFAQTKSVSIPNAADGTPRVASSTNHLLETYPGAIGVKTGYTDAAKLVLVSAAERDGRRLYAVVMGSDQHFADAAALLDYGFDKFRLMSVMTAGATHEGYEGISDIPEPIVDEVVPVPVVIPVVEYAVVPTVQGGRAYLVTTADGVEVERIIVETSDKEPLPNFGGALEWLLGFFR